jgi:hypothetical protein
MSHYRSTRSVEVDVNLVADVAKALPETERELWLSYAASEKNGAREQAEILRAKLIAAIQAHPSDERAHFALAFVELARRGSEAASEALI